MDDVKIKSNVENLQLYSESHPFSLSLRMKNFDSEASYKKFVRNCEGIIRKSIEYKLWRNYIVDVLKINTCTITHETMSEVTIEVHHHIPSLYVLVKSLVNKCIEAGEEFCTFDVCTDAIELHFKNKIGYVTLLRSMHEKFHNGALDIPIEFIKGDFHYFMQKYLDYLDDEDIDKMQYRMAMKEANCNWVRNNYPAAMAEAL
ncbi:MAG: hypothetical protein ACTSX1_05110 [Candidatus Heimdallarchaeaceae archaeon]